MQNARQAEALTDMLSMNLYISYGECQSDSRLLFAKELCNNTLGDRLNLPIINWRKVVRQEFGNEKGSLNTSNTVQIALKSADNLTVYINAPIIPLLCSPLSNQGINVTFIDMYPHLRNLPFSACGDGNMDLKIDMMIGAQFVHCFLLDQVARGGAAPRTRCNTDMLWLCIEWSSSTSCKRYIFVKYHCIARIEN